MLWAARTVTRSLSTSARDDSDSHLQADLSSPWTSVSPNCFLRIICLASAAAASAHTSAATCDTATWEVVAACAMRRAKGANKSGGRLASGSFRIIKVGGRGRQERGSNKGNPSWVGL